MIKLQKITFVLFILLSIFWIINLNRGKINCVKGLDKILNIVPCEKVQEFKKGFMGTPIQGE